MRYYAINDLAKRAGVSVRTLYHDDQIDLLKPSVRSRANDRLYGRAALMQLQQIPVDKERQFALGQIVQVLDAPDFNLLPARESHRQALEVERDRLAIFAQNG